MDDKRFIEANNLIEEAELKIKGSCCSNLFKSLHDRKLEALDNYERGANLFKMGNFWKEAGDSFVKVAEIKEQDNEDATGDYQEAAFCYGKIDIKKQEELNEILIQIYEKNNDFSQLARMKLELAELQAKNEKFDDAIKLFKKSADYYQMDKEGNKKKRNDALIKAADLMCMIDHKDTYLECSTIYQDVGLEYLRTPVLINYGFETALKCVCVYLAYSDVISGEAFLSKFKNEQLSFSNSDEYRFLTEAIEAIKEDNPERFESATSYLRNNKSLAKWKIPIFSRIKSKFTGGQIVHMLNKNKKNEANFEQVDIDWK